MFNWLFGNNDTDDYNPRYAPSTDEDTQPFTPITDEQPAVNEPGGLLQSFTNMLWGSDGKERR